MAGRPPGSGARVTGADEVALRIVARSMVRELAKQGYGLRHIVALANELIDLTCEHLRAHASGAPAEPSPLAPASGP